MGSEEVATIQDIATMEKVSDRFVSRIIRLAYLSPDVLERLVIWRVAPSVTVNELAKILRHLGQHEQPWS